MQMTCRLITGKQELPNRTGERLTKGVITTILKYFKIYTFHSNLVAGVANFLIETLLRIFKHPLPCLTLSMCFQLVMNCIQFTLFVYSSFIYKDTEPGWEEFPLCGPWQRSTLLVSDTCPQRSAGLHLSRNSFQMLLPKRHEKQSINSLNSIIEFWSDDITEMIFLKLWVLFDCSEQPIWKKFTCKSLAL